MKLPMIIIAFLIGLWCFLMVAGWVVRFVLGLQWDEHFISDFVHGGFIAFGRVMILLFAIGFVYIVSFLIRLI
jgi:hypothetical protein